MNTMVTKFIWTSFSNISNVKCLGIREIVNCFIFIFIIVLIQRIRTLKLGAILINSSSLTKRWLHAIILRLEPVHIVHILWIHYSPSVASVWAIHLHSLKLNHFILVLLLHLLLKFSIMALWRTHKLAILVKRLLIVIHLRLVYCSLGQVIVEYLHLSSFCSHTSIVGKGIRLLLFLLFRYIVIVLLQGLLRASVWMRGEIAILLSITHTWIVFKCGWLGSVRMTLLRILQTMSFCRILTGWNWMMAVRHRW